MYKWTKGAPPEDDKTYLLKFASGVVCSGRFRLGVLGEPQQDVLFWRCDCCGRFAEPQEWAEIVG